MKTKFVIYIPISPNGWIRSAYADEIAADAKKRVAAAYQVTWGKLLTQGWRVVKFEGRKGAK